jgi:methionine sulfoxide reductase heme-binding subunit
MNAAHTNGPQRTAVSASPLSEGERIGVRGFLRKSAAARNPHPTLSLEKGEATNRRGALFPEFLLKILRHKLFALGVLVGVGIWFLVLPALTGALGANPVEKLLHHSGEIAIWTLGAVLALSPLRVLFPRARIVNALNRHRRTIGVSACVYGLMHFGFHLLYEGDAQAIALSFSKPFIWFGLGGLSILVILGLTSNQFSIRAFGGRNWKRLHRLAYIAAALLIYHQAIAGKGHWHIARWLLFVLGLLQTARATKMLVTRSQSRSVSPNPPSTGSYFHTEKTGLTKYQQKVAGRPSQLKQLAAIQARDRSILGVVASPP